MTCILHNARTSNVDSVMFVNKIKEMVSFKPSKEVEKGVFHLVTGMGQRKILSPHEELNLRPSRIPCPEALLLSHRDSMVSNAHYEVHENLFHHKGLLQLVIISFILITCFIWDDTVRRNKMLSQGSRDLLPYATIVEEMGTYLGHTVLLRCPLQTSFQILCKSLQFPDLKIQHYF